MMKKLALLSIVLILLATTAVPVLARAGTSNGHGNGNGNGQGNSAGVDPGNQAAKEKNQNKGHGQSKNGIGFSSSMDQGKIRENFSNKWMFTPFYLQGTITAIDTGAGTLTVNVIHANAKVKEFIGTDLTLTVNDATQIFQINQGEEVSKTVGLEPSDSENTALDENGTPGNRVPITFDQLEVGQRVAIHGNLVDTAYTARLITVYIGHPVGEPSEVNP